ncbi:RDD family protein [Chryseobacterium populi]|uniref:Putative membrane protein n=1 Tax=Chryseobacterium populi TaxID=1144316 RepID=J3CLF3_9FLAO|nr:RDD family protein [Chryseobacterium populi]EJL73911.1 putative membrane protein [Chryseobacterium populi]
MRKHLRIVEDHRAEKGIRLVNYFIDLVVFYIIYFILLTVLYIISPAFNSWISNLNPIADRLMSVTFYIFYIFLTESLMKGRSIGKLITGTKVIMIDGTTPSLPDYFIRNIIRGIILIDQLSFLGETGFHDSWSNTRVIKIKDYENQLKAKNEINSIGTKEIT